jgi:hypothetical protein
MGEILVKGLFNFGISLVCTTLIPKAVGNKHFPLSGNAEGEAAIQVITKGYLQVVGFKSVKGNVDLVKTFGGEQPGSVLGKQGSVGGENNLETCICCHFEKIEQQRMTERFPHQMKVKEICERLQFRQQKLEFFPGQSVFLSLCSGAEAAIQVADIGNFQIDLSESFHFLQENRVGPCAVALGILAHNSDIFGRHGRNRDHCAGEETTVLVVECFAGLGELHHMDFPTGGAFHMEVAVFNVEIMNFGAGRSVEITIEEVFHNGFMGLRACHYDYQKP